MLAYRSLFGGDCCLDDADAFAGVMPLLFRLLLELLLFDLRCCCGPGFVPAVLLVEESFLDFGACKYFFDGCILV